MTYLPVDAEGKVKLSALQEALCEETILVSIMYVNNEMGAVQPIEEAARIIKGYNNKILFACGCSSRIWKISDLSKADRG